MKAVLLHQRDHVNASLIWRETPPLEEVENALGVLRDIGYFASAYPERDGLTIQRENYQSETALLDVRKAFPGLFIVEGDRDGVWAANLFAGIELGCRILVPVDKLTLDVDLDLGRFKIWRPVDGEAVLVGTHPVGSYYLGADPTEEFHRRALASKHFIARLVQYPLIDVKAMIPKAHFYNSDQRGKLALLHYCCDEADRALDLLRYSLCHFGKREHIPNQAGQLADGTSAVYLDPDEDSQFRDTMVGGIAYAMRTTTNWLGLEIPRDPNLDPRFVSIADGTAATEVAEAVRASISLMNSALYITVPEAAFLQLLTGLESLVLRPHLKGPKARAWVASALEPRKSAKWSKLRDNYDSLYTMRNSIVHRGTRLSHFPQVQDVWRPVKDAQRLLGLAIERVVDSQCTTKHQLEQWIDQRSRKN